MNILGKKIFSYLFNETFEKCSILFKIKEGDNFNRRNIPRYFED